MGTQGAGVTDVADELKVGMRVLVRIPDKPDLDSEGFILARLLPGDGRELFQVDMGDHDNWFPAGWLRPQHTKTQT